MLSSCKKDDPPPTAIPAPSVTSFTPTTATQGATVTITGTNFTGTTAVIGRRNSISQPA
ncbi:MAG: IPT/TIG domain-containing protein [Cytophagales bacterium]